MRLFTRALRVVALLAVLSAGAAFAQSVYDAPYSGCANHGYGAPSFRWGWFGVENHRDPARWHRSYYGYPMQWKTYRRY